MIIKSKPNVEDFLNNAKTDLSLKRTSSLYRRQKIVKLPMTTLLKLKHRAIYETENTGIRVTENDIIEKAILTYLNIKI